MRTRTATGAAAGVLALAGLVGCSDDSGSGAAAGDPTPTVAAAGSVPEGTWTRTVTMQDAEDLGLDRAVASKLLGADGVMPTDLEVAAGTWKIYVTNDQGKRQLGDFGTWQTDDQGRWITRSESPGCRGCVTAIRVGVDGDRVTTEIDDGDAPADDGHLVTEGTWTRRV